MELKLKDGNCCRVLYMSFNRTLNGIETVLTKSGEKDSSRFNRSLNGIETMQAS